MKSPVRYNGESSFLYYRIFKWVTVCSAVTLNSNTLHSNLHYFSNCDIYPLWFWWVTDTLGKSRQKRFLCSGEDASEHWNTQERQLPGETGKMGCVKLFSSHFQTQMLVLCNKNQTRDRAVGDFLHLFWRKQMTLDFFLRNPEGLK